MEQNVVNLGWDKTQKVRLPTLCFDQVYQDSFEGSLGDYALLLDSKKGVLLKVLKHTHKVYDGKYGEDFYLPISQGTNVDLNSSEIRDLEQSGLLFKNEKK